MFSQKAKGVVVFGPRADSQSSWPGFVGCNSQRHPASIALAWRVLYRVNSWRHIESTYSVRHPRRTSSVGTLGQSAHRTCHRHGRHSTTCAPKQCQFTCRHARSFTRNGTRVCFPTFLMIQPTHIPYLRSLAQLWPDGNLATVTLRHAPTATYVTTYNNQIASSDAVPGYPLVILHDESRLLR